MLALRVAILWHQHQPYYKDRQEFILPWVRLHGVKDYVDLPRILEEFPGLRQTFNVVPSLLKQINGYVEEGIRDAVQRLSLVPAGMLNQDERREILRTFFLCNPERMIQPYPRYNELYERSRDTAAALQHFSEQDWRDIQVWYNLTWVGPVSRNRPDIQYLLNKACHYSEEDKQRLLAAHIDILADVIPVLRELEDGGQVEVSASPMYHPILPLLCNSAIAREAMPDVQLPPQTFCYPQDARAQIEQGVDFLTATLGKRPEGMWPSEGSVSDAALALVAQAGLQWVATDEQILQRTMGESYRDTEKYFPHTLRTPYGELGILFRDHALSDAIGFVYSTWQAEDAAHDFCTRLRAIRERIIEQHGEQALQQAAVPVILDGENCWEYYADNGAPFLRALFRCLSSAKDIETITCMQAVQSPRRPEYRPLEHIFPGSWINADFKIWIGHHEDNRAWSLLHTARRALDEQREHIASEQYRQALEELYIAEGSDWFWWYGDEHHTENIHAFDNLFRAHLERFYAVSGLPVPDAVYLPIKHSGFMPELHAQTALIAPIIDGKQTWESEWQGAGYCSISGSGGAMHRAQDLLRRIHFGSGVGRVYLRLDLARALMEGEHIEIHIEAAQSLHIHIGPEKTALHHAPGFAPANLSVALGAILEIAFAPEGLLNEEFHTGTGAYRLPLAVQVVSHEFTLRFPPVGRLEPEFLSVPRPF